MLLQLLQRNSDYRPDDIAIEYNDQKITHNQLLKRVEKCARGLINLGLKPQDRVGIFLENSPEFIISFFAVAACRGVNVPLSLEYKEDELKFFLGDANASYFIVDSPRLALGNKVASGLTQAVSVIAVGSVELTDGAMSFDSLSDHADKFSLPNGNLDDDLIYIYSSGTTGRPKCISRTVIQYWWEMDDVIETISLTKEDIIFCTIPLFHNFGAVQCMMTSIGSGAKLVIFANPNPFLLRRNKALELLEESKATIFPCVPFLLDHFVDAAKTADLSSIRLLYSTAAKLYEETAVAFQKKFSVLVREQYGCTEVGCMTINLDDEKIFDRESVGNAFAGVNLRILDDNDNELPCGEIGEIVVKSRAMTRGYSGVDVQDKDIFRNNSFYTGDLGLLDPEGRLFLRGRKKFIIEVVGHKLSPMEVEDVLAEHTAVQECLVVGMPDPNSNEQVVKAYVVRSEACTKSELIGFCRERMANYKVPQEIDFISKIPKNALGKIIRKNEVLDALVITEN